VPPVLVVGCQPEFVGERMELSPAVQQAVPAAVSLVERTVMKSIGRQMHAAEGAAEETA
jgi:hypothetical protein